MEYSWANGSGKIIKAEYDSSKDSLSNEQLELELVSALQQFGHNVTCSVSNPEYNEVYSVIIDGDEDNELFICLKGTTPGGRSNLDDEQRIQQKSKHINYAYSKKQEGKKAAHLGVYRRDGQTIFCAWALKPSTANPNTPISKQIKITSIADAMKYGFVQQSKGNGEQACAFRKEFIYFYLNNIDAFHSETVQEISEKGKLDSSTSKVDVGENILFYGVPGIGKSYKIKTEYCDDDNFMERVVFHPDYSNSDFIGQILPSNINGNISYPFIPGPFTRILKKATDHPESMFYLVIEEINRGNAPAIFGEVFQLLDRVNGESEYGISNAEIAREVYRNPDQKVKIPANLTILATMNTADQNVFTLDTAFKRRWKMISIPNNFDDCELSNLIIGGTNLTWREFAESINSIIIDNNKSAMSSEDKRLGAYFVTADEITDAHLFAEKVLAYLWDDVFQYDRSKVFNPGILTLDQLIDSFVSSNIDVFFDDALKFLSIYNNDIKEQTT